MQRLATEAELRALRAQLNPHFLFNALTTIGYLIQTAPTRAVDTLLRLTHVLRGVLRRSTSEFSTLAEEIDLIAVVPRDRACAVRRAARGRRSTCRPRLAASACRRCCCSRIVENAVKHGLVATRQGGALHIEGRARRRSLAPSSRGFRAGIRSRPRLALSRASGSPASRSVSRRTTAPTRSSRSTAHPAEARRCASRLPAERRSRRALDFPARRTG